MWNLKTTYKSRINVHFAEAHTFKITPVGINVKHQVESGCACEEACRGHARNASSFHLAAARSFILRSKNSSKYQNPRCATLHVVILFYRSKVHQNNLIENLM